MLIVNMLRQFKAFLAWHLALARLQKNNPTCRFYPGVSIAPDAVFGKYNVLFSGAMISGSTLGDHTFIQKNTSVTNADVGKFCSVAPGVSIGLSQHPAVYVSMHPAFYSSTQPVAKTFSETDDFKPLKRTTVGHDVWIGQNALIMDGVRVGTGAIIAAGAVVTREVPDYAIAAGVPAKVLKYRFDEEARKKLLATEWWNKDEAWLKEHCGLFLNPERFLAHFAGSEKR